MRSNMRLQLGRFVDDVHGRRDFAAVVQKSRDLQLVAVLVGHREVLQRTDRAVVDGLREHHRQHRHALAMAAGIRRLVVDRRVDEIDEGLEQVLEMVDQ